MRYFFIVFLITAFSFPAAAAHYDNAGTLRQFCQSGYDTDYGYCAGFLTAIADVMMDHSAYGYTACVAPNIKPQQLTDNIIAYMDAFQVDPLMPAKEYVAAMLADRFPCR